jgi:hypothetical protein
MDLTQTRNLTGKQNRNYSGRVKIRQTPLTDDFDDFLVVPDTIPNIGPLVAVD